jgi:hypothetical protein
LVDHQQVIRARSWRLVYQEYAPSERLAHSCVSNGLPREPTSRDPPRPT